MNRLTLFLFILISLIGKSQNTTQKKLTFPKAAIITRTDTLHGDTRIDPYHWIRDKKNPKVIDYIKKENAYATQELASAASLKKQLFNEMKGRIEEGDEQVPFKKGSYYYYSRKIKGKDYPIYCRKKDGDTKEEIVVDANELAKNKSYLAILSYYASPNENFVAFLIDFDGSEQCSLLIKDLEKNKIINENISGLSGVSFAWALNCQTYFYVAYDSTGRGSKAFRHTMGSSSTKDTCVFEEKNELYEIWVKATKDNKIITFDSFSLDDTENNYLRADRPYEFPKLLFQRKENSSSWLDHNDGKFYVLSNRSNPYFDLLSISDSATRIEEGKFIFKGTKEQELDDYQIFKDFVVYKIRENGGYRLFVINIANNERYPVEIDEDDYNVSMADNNDISLNYVRFEYSSLKTPSTTIDYNMITREKVVKKTQKIPSGYNANDYQTEKIFATATDGTKIPISLVYKKGVAKNGNNPTLLTAYGAYGRSYDVEFGSKLISLFDRGFVYAIAHVRGGGEYGKEWYDHGKLLNKKNSFSDFISCTEYLIKEGYTNSSKLAVEGGSAGGLLISEVLNERPELYKAALLNAPWVDVLNDLLDAGIASIPFEWQHLGDPMQKNYYDYIKSYCPYTNVKKQSYPNLFVKAGLNDPRVLYWGPVKFVAKLRSMKTDKNTLILKTDMGGGHFGGTGTYNRIWERAEDFAFILKSLGVNK